jgi:hypothetical protein
MGEHRPKLGRQGPEREIGARHPRCHLVQLCVWDNGVDGAHCIANNVEVAPAISAIVDSGPNRKSTDRLGTD